MKGAWNHRGKERAREESDPQSTLFCPLYRSGRVRESTSIHSSFFLLLRGLKASFADSLSASLTFSTDAASIISKISYILSISGAV